MRVSAAVRALFTSICLASVVVAAGGAAGGGKSAASAKGAGSAGPAASGSGAPVAPSGSGNPGTAGGPAPAASAAAPGGSASAAATASAASSASAPAVPAPAPSPAASAPAVPASSPAPAAAGSTKAGGGAPDDTAIDGATYAVRLRDLESKVDELKEQIRRSHTRLSLLSDTILGGGVGGARAEIRFRNEMSSAFRLTRALFVLDGAVQYNRQDDTGALAAQTEIPIFTGSIPPGDHTLQVLIQLRGHGYGVFSYLRGYKFEVKSSHAFTVTEGKTMELEVTAWEKGGVTTPLEQRPAVRYLEKIRNGTGGEAGTRAPGTGGGESGASVSGGFSVDTGKK